MDNWQRLTKELQAWQTAGLAPTLWWRDDDAQQHSPALARLNRISLGYQVPLFLAVIPQGVDEDLSLSLAENPRLWLLQHGFSHCSHAPAAERKCELGDHRPLDQVLAELTAGWQQLQRFEDRVLPVLVPPWNRISDRVAEQLPALGFQRLSVLGARPQQPAIAECNVHVDLISWKQRRFAGEGAVLEQLIGHLRARREGRAERTEPTGLMTHHLAHDEACWTFLERLFDYLRSYPAIRWLDGGEVVTT